VPAIAAAALHMASAATIAAVPRPATWREKHWYEDF
jgi:hypothetical protein